MPRSTMNIHTNTMVETSVPERDGYNILIEIEEERDVCMYVCVCVECERDRVACTGNSLQY